MNRVLLFVLLLVVGKGALSQERIDTLYYSRSGMTVRNPVFADYYRLALYPADAAGRLPEIGGAHIRLFDSTPGDFGSDHLGWSTDIEACYA